MNFDDYESLPTSNVGVHMIAGAFAGIMEHCVLYPLDSVKTRMQVLTPGTTIGGGVRTVLFDMVRKEGLLRPLRGIGSMMGSAGPAHALYFSCYEFIKNKLINPRTHQFNNLVYGFAGCVATLLHDAVMNPAEVVKQRLQMYNSPYRSVTSCFHHVYSKEGFVAFYRSYPTQLTMNVPFQVIHFIAYESAQNVTNPEHVFNPKAHIISGAFAGAVAAACTTPLDVCKTLLNTQQGVRPKGMIEAFRTVYRYEGLKGYFRGISARVFYQMPATAICWSTYEFFKYILNNSQGDIKIRTETDEISSATPVTTSSSMQSSLPRSTSFQGAGLYFNNKPPAPVLLEVTCTRG